MARILGYQDQEFGEEFATVQPVSCVSVAVFAGSIEFFRPGLAVGPIPITESFLNCHYYICWGVIARDSRPLRFWL
jgi:hypothetical protein